MKSQYRIPVIGLIAAILSSVQSSGQALVSGRVVEGSGGPLAGVAVRLVVRNLSTTTATDGTFEIRQDATTAPFSARRFGSATLRLLSGILRVDGGDRPARIRVRLFDSRGRVVAVPFDGFLRPGATLQAPIFRNGAGIACGVYVLDVAVDGVVGRYKLLHAGRAAQRLPSMSLSGTQAKALAAIDTVRLTKSGCTRRDVALEEYPAALGDITVNCGDADVLGIPKIEFLKSDEPNPGSIAKYVSDRNRGNGSGSSAANAQEVQAALDGAGAGQVLVAVAQTPGAVEFWQYPSGLKFPDGSAGKYVTLQARNGDGIVISKDEDFAAFRTPDGGKWTVYDAAKKIWKSTQTFSGGAARLYGVWYEFDNPHFLLAYNSLSGLSALYGTDNTPTSYGTPGAVLHTDGHVYIRMQKPNPDKYSVGRKWQAHLWPGHPEAVKDGALNYPVTEDPNSYAVYLYRRASVSAFDGNFVKIGSGINTLGYRNIWQGDHDIVMRRGTDITWREFIQVMSGYNYDVERRRIANGSKRHAARSEWKFGGWLEGDRGAFIENCCDQPGHSMFFKDCTIRDYHELMVGGLYQFRWRNCVIFNILDDGIQALPSLRQVEIGYCFVMNSALGGNGSPPRDSNGGRWYVHHNVVDARTQKCSDWRAETTPPFLWLNHSASGSQPRKNYNNTVLFGPDPEDEQGFGFNHNSNRDNTSSEAHEVFNNLFIRHDTQRYDPAWSGNLGRRTDNVGRLASVSAAFSNEFWDFNLYYRDVPKVNGVFVDGLLKQWRKGKDNDERQFDSLGAFRNSDFFTLSKQGGALRGAYAPGFEANGTDRKPSLASLDQFPARRFNYRPAATTEVTVATDKSLSGANWWSTPPAWGTAFPWNDGSEALAPSPWKGALDPKGTGMTVGVLDP